MQNLTYHNETISPVSEMTGEADLALHMEHCCLNSQGHVAPVYAIQVQDS